MVKPTLGYLRVFFSPDMIKVEGEGDEQTRELHVDIQDELRITPDFFNTDGVLIEFDGGNLKLTRESFLELLKEYNIRYEKQVHHAAIEELLKAVENLSDPMRTRFDSNLHFLKQQLDQRREKKEK